MTILLLRYKSRLIFLIALVYFDVLYAFTQGVWQAPFWGEFKVTYFLGSLSGHILVLLTILIVFQAVLIFKLRYKLCSNK